jgi:pyridinium-3,5-bisthiocarboxylic acid mononucleotide nickel chelatase
MSRVAYFDTFSGASGDMIVAALLDAGLSLDTLRSELAKLPIEGYQLSTTSVRKNGFAAIKFDVLVEHQHEVQDDHEHGHRNLATIAELIHASTLSSTVKANAIAVFTRLAEAEAAVHGTSVDKIHFHEVGAIDSIVDIVGAAIGLHELGIDRVVSGPLRFGCGEVQCQHGTLPVPAPATLALAKGFPVEYTGLKGELTTPTGAALLTTLADAFGLIPSMTVRSTGIGAGQADRPERPNMLRVIIGEEAATNGDCVVVIEANIDDTTPEVVAYAAERLLEAGALDVFTLPAQMKKSRPGVLLTVIGRPADRAALEKIIFRETSTFGVRRREENRTVLERETVEVSLLGTTCRVKLARLDGAVITLSPEYEDCSKLARAKAIPVREVYDAVRMLAEAHHLNSLADE